jgi:hypothetical protein
LNGDLDAKLASCIPGLKNYKKIENLMSGQAELFPDLFDRVVFFCYPFYLNKNE